MPIRTVDLSVEKDAFVEEIVRAGKYRNASEAKAARRRSATLCT
jgi:Arc/MetJ-type ribon-helix-helix transcriptional regulator